MTADVHAYAAYAHSCGITLTVRTSQGHRRVFIHAFNGKCEGRGLTALEAIMTLRTNMVAHSRKAP